ncbi:MAG: hypothetical protein GJ676_19670 [Rhodobacteraceae bacterium]|nr:hypothetical protein [Paracoccaceae bacterium]
MTSRSKRLSTLFLLAILLISSAGIRIFFETGPALAKEISEQENWAGKPQPHTQTSSDDTPPNFQEMLTAFREREAAIEQREMEIADRVHALEIAETAIDQKLAALIVAEENLKQTLTLADGASEGDLTRLTTVYEQMKPKDSAALFEQMDPEFAAGFLARMQPDAAAAVMAGLEPNTAYTISVVMAGKNANVPTE